LIFRNIFASLSHCNVVASVIDIRESINVAEAFASAPASSSASTEAREAREATEATEAAVVAA
jgi:hypothetical protein